MQCDARKPHSRLGGYNVSDVFVDDLSTTEERMETLRRLLLECRAASPVRASAVGLPTSWLYMPVRPHGSGRLDVCSHF